MRLLCAAGLKQEGQTWFFCVLYGTNIADFPGLGKAVEKTLKSGHEKGKPSLRRIEVFGRRGCNGIIRKAVMYCIDAGSKTEISSLNPHVFDPKTVLIKGDTVLLPPAAAAAIEIVTE